MSKITQDLIIIGAGPSSLSAAIYTTRENISTLVFEKSGVGGQAAIIDKIDNYPGFPDGVEGYILSEQLEKQAKRFGAQIEYGDVTKIKDKGDIKVVTVDGKEKKAKTVLISTGRGYGKINAPGESEYFGKGVHYCATCDGAFYKNRRLIVVGGANSAIQEAIYLTRFASHIDLLVRSTIKSSDILKKKLMKLASEGKITIHLETTIDEIVAKKNKLSHVIANEKGKSIKIETDGIFIFAGMKPNTDFLVGSGVDLDEAGYIKTDDKLCTNIPGVFASGDVRSGSTKQIVCATGEGAIVAISIREYLINLK